MIGIGPVTARERGCNCRDRRGLRAADAGGLRTAGTGRARGGEAVIETWIGLAVAIGLVGYLLASLLFPDRF
ncbi:K(+)-transporting ATPase subunit F [Geodermatophilus sp. Leaf369]|uniref:K(+)-transporting ATPase subunit F n=1 Tax=Geodermatophilus sp. Leaf369 TaxID=1736354 RepID=UPI0019109852